MELYSNKLSCFFCLRSNSRNYLNPQDETHFCENAEEVVSSFHEFSLRNLYRFLNLLHSDKEEKDFNELKMPICEDCFRLNGEFNKLYNLLEETKLRLNWCLKKLQGIMTEATRNEVNVMEEVDDDRTILDVWRTHTLDRIKNVIRTSFPRVLLHEISKKRSQSAFLNDLSDCEPVGQEEQTAKRMRTQDEKRDETITQSNMTMSLLPTTTQDEPELSILALPHHDLSLTIASGDEGGTEREEIEIVYEDDDIDAGIKNEFNEKGKDTTPDKAMGKEIEKLEKEDDQVYEDDNSAIKMEESEGTDSTQPRIKMDVFPDNNYYIQSKLECDVENCNELQTQVQLKKYGAMRAPRQKEKAHPKKLQIENQLRCIYCRYVCSVRGNSSLMKEVMDLHHARFHPDHFFLPEKSQLSGVKRKQFQKILVHFLFPQFIRRGKVGEVRSCTLCARKYQIHRGNVEDDFKMRRHLVMVHKSEMTRRLKVILKDDKLEEKLVSCGPEGVWCPCGVYFKSRKRMQYHKTRHCILIAADENDDDEDELSAPLDFKSSEPLENNDIEVETNGLKMITQETPVMIEVGYHHSNDEGVEEEIHNVLNTPDIIASPKSRVESVDKTTKLFCNNEEITLPTQENTLMMDLEEETGNEESSSTSNVEAAATDDVAVESGPSFMANFLPGIAKLKLYCKLCTRTLRRSDALAHWKHYCIKGLRLPMTSTAKAKKKCTSDRYKAEVPTIAKAWPYMRSRKSKKKRGETVSFSCTYCRFVCSAKYSEFRKRVELHQVRYHPEHFFPEEKEQVSGVKLEQFQRILVGFLFPRFMKKDGDHRSCTLCEMEYQNSNWDHGYLDFRRHLILQHINELKQKLKVILECKSLEEKLMNCGKTEVWCRCGMYLPRGSGIHRALYCNLTAPHPDKDGDIIKETSKGRLKLQSERCTASGQSDPQGNSSSKCAHCPFTSTAVSRGKWNSMEMHLVQVHPEHNFPEERVKAAGLGLRCDKFQTLILGYLCSQFIRVGDRRWICTICGKKYCTAKVYYREMVLRKHLISEHKNELKEKLQSILVEIAQGSKLGNYFSSDNPNPFIKYK